MNISTEGRSLIVTGGSRGIGLGIARAWAGAGGNVCITARKSEELDRALDELAAGERAIAVAGHVADRNHAEESVQKCLDAFGSVDALANNAATNPQFGPLITAEMSAVEKIFQVNLEAPIVWSQIVWDRWMRDNGGTILNIASVGGIRAEPMIGAYNMCKAALIHLTKQLASELSPAVRVNALAPGLVKTKLARALWEAGEDAIAARLPLRRLGTPEDIGSAALFLMSDEASWITGETLVVDGGALLGGFR